MRRRVRGEIVLACIARCEEFLVSAALGAMVLLVLIQIVLRNFFSIGIPGGAEMVRHLVLWVAFLGAGLAARDRKHIKIELAGHLVTPTAHRLFELATGLFSVIICSILFYASITFVYVDYQGGGAIAFFNVPVWILQVIIPVGFAVITLRFALRFVENVRSLVKGE